MEAKYNSIRPVGPMVAIKLVQVTQAQTASGIVVPNHGHCEAEVLAVGDDENIHFGVGERVILAANFGAVRVRVEDEDVLLVRYPEILAVRTNKMAA